MSHYQKQKTKNEVKAFQPELSSDEPDFKKTHSFNQLQHQQQVEKSFSKHFKVQEMFKKLRNQNHEFNQDNISRLTN